MSHYTVLIASKSKEPESFNQILADNDWSDYEDEWMPFGFDYLCPLDKELKPTLGKEYIFHKAEFEHLEDYVSMVIDSEGRELWWHEGISSAIPDITLATALTLIPEDHWCCLFDGHL